MSIYNVGERSQLKTKLQIKEKETFNKYKIRVKKLPSGTLNGDLRSHLGLE